MTPYFDPFEARSSGRFPPNMPMKAPFDFVFPEDTNPYSTSHLAPTELGKVGTLAKISPTIILAAIVAGGFLIYNKYK